MLKMKKNKNKLKTYYWCVTNKSEKKFEMQRICRLSIHISKRNLFKNSAIFSKPLCFIKKRFSSVENDLGFKLYQEGKFTEAIEYLQHKLKTIEDDPIEKASIYNNIALIYEQQDEILKAIEMYKKSLIYNNNDPVIYTNIGTLFYRQGKKEKAEEMYKKAIELNPEYVACHYRLGQLYSMKENKTAEAEHHLQKCIEYDPKNFRAYGELAVLYSRQSNDEEKKKKSLELVEKMIEYSPPGDLSGYHVKAYLLSRLQQFDDAIQIYIEMGQKHPNDAKIWRNLANIQLSANKKEDALDSISKAYEISPHDSEVLYTLIQVLDMNNRTEEAEHIMREMLRTNPENTAMYGNLATFLSRRGRKEEAITLLIDTSKKYPHLKKKLLAYKDLIERGQELEQHIVPK